MTVYMVVAIGWDLHENVCLYSDKDKAEACKTMMLRLNPGRNFEIETFEVITE